jgi:hypothetical protein
MASRTASQCGGRFSLNVAVAAFCTFILPGEHKFIMLRYCKCIVMQAGASSPWNGTKNCVARQNLVPVLVPVGVGIPSISVHRSALLSLLVSVDINHFMRGNASPCEAVQNP